MENNNLSKFAQKALYFGVGLFTAAADKASSVAEQANQHLSGLRLQAQSLMDELVERGAMSAEEARTYMDDLIKKTQDATQSSSQSDSSSTQRGPRKIQIDDVEEDHGSSGSAPSTDLVLTEEARLRQEIAALQAELDRLKRQEQDKA